MLLYAPMQFSKHEQLEQEAQSEKEPYQLLVGHPRTDGSEKTDEELRRQYVHLTDKLIHKITEGVSVTDPETGELVEERPDYVVWLDKSARPVAWLTKDLWPILATDESGETPERPEFRFVNIDRNHWLSSVDPDGTGIFDIDRVDETVIRSLRSIFVDVNHKRAGLTEEIDKAPSQLDDKTVLIVDEVRATGSTLSIAKKFFEKAFPTARVAGTHWMGGVAQKGNAQGNADLPVWYSENVTTGRGVGNKKEKISERSKGITQRLGRQFLSTRFETPDQTSLQLRKEFKMLTQEVLDSTVTVVPAYDRDDFDERFERLNKPIE